MNNKPIEYVETVKGYRLNKNELGCKRGANCFECKEPKCVYGYDFHVYTEKRKEQCKRYREKHKEQLKQKRTERRQLIKDKERLARLLDEIREEVRR